ncbi:MAG: helix-turn-helix domain-containing protein [Candidatus Dormibacteria bacterium]
MERQEIRELRRRHGWTQAQLAAELGTDAVTVSRWERGVAVPRPSAARRLAGLAGGRSREITELVKLLGEDRALRLLRRAELLSRPAPQVTFAIDPALRLAQMERALREQEELRRRLRSGS